MVPQYEAGRKQKAAWHKQQNDPQPLFVWETLTGADTGTYIVGRLGQHWADFDKPAIPDEADVAEYQKVVGAYVDSVVARYYEYMPKVSNPTADKVPSKVRRDYHLLRPPGKNIRLRVGDDASQRSRDQDQGAAQLLLVLLVERRTNQRLCPGFATQQLGRLRRQNPTSSPSATC